MQDKCRTDRQERQGAGGSLQKPVSASYVSCVAQEAHEAALLGFNTTSAAHPTYHKDQVVETVCPTHCASMKSTNSLFDMNGRISASSVRASRSCVALTPCKPHTTKVLVQSGPCRQVVCVLRYERGKQ